MSPPGIRAHHGARESVPRSVPATDVAAQAPEHAFGHPNQKEPIMFPSSTLHTDFARQLQHDRRADVVIARRPSGADRPRIAARVAALVLVFRHATAARPAVR